MLARVVMRLWAPIEGAGLVGRRRARACFQPFSKHSAGSQLGRVLVPPPPLLSHQDLHCTAGTAGISRIASYFWRPLLQPSSTSSATNQSLSFRATKRQGQFSLLVLVRLLARPPTNPIASPSTQPNQPLVDRCITRVGSLVIACIAPSLFAARPALHIQSESKVAPPAWKAPSPEP